jgi:hypothetical protein
MGPALTRPSRFVAIAAAVMAFVAHDVKAQVREIRVT